MNFSDYGNSSSGFNFEDLFKNTEKIKNPNGMNNHVVPLDNFKHGTLRIFQQMHPGFPPVEVSRMEYKEGNRLSLNESFKGVVAGPPKDETKKYQIEYVGYNEKEVQHYKLLEEPINRKTN